MPATLLRALPGARVSAALRRAAAPRPDAARDGGGLLQLGHATRDAAGDPAYGPGAGDPGGAGACDADSRRATSCDASSSSAGSSSAGSWSWLR